MGHDSNHIEKSPVDMLHTIWGGLMKNMCGFILSILNQIGKYSKDARFSKILETLDRRISDFPKIYEKVPHVQWTSFPNGLVSKLLEGMSSESGGNTGRGGGFRSAHFVPALFQIYFALESLLPVKSVTLSKTQQVCNNGSDGGVGTKTREVLEQKLENVAEVVKDAIESLLHFNFELCRDYWNKELIKNLREIVSDMKRKYVALWRLREQALFRFGGTLPGLKLHDPEHFSDFIKDCVQFGDGRQGLSKCLIKLSKIFGTKLLVEKKRNVTS